MKKVIALLLCVALVLSFAGCTGGGNAVETAANDYFANFTNNRIISWDDLFAKIDAGENPFILSVRQKDVYDAGHIKGAYLASWGPELAEKVALLPTDQPVYVYCYSGQTAGQTVALLNILGIEAYSVKSGYNKGAMTVEGYEAYVETTANELADAGASFDKDVLAFVQEYFNAVLDNANFKITSENIAPLAGTGDIVVLDIRKADDYAAGHIEGAINIPYGANMQEKFTDTDLPKDKKIVVACYSGQTAGQTTAVLRALGYDAVSLHFGMKGWSTYSVTAAANKYFSEYPGSRIITWEDLFAKIDAEENPFILSVRQKDVYDEGHIKGAYLASWGPELAEKVALLPTDQPVYVYCYSGQTAGQTVALLNILGIETYSVKSGYNKGAMTVEGYEAYVETTANELADAGASFDSSVLSFVKTYFNTVLDNANFKMDYKVLKEKLDANDESILVLSIRQAEDYAKGHIAGAINIPFGANMQESFKDLPTDKKIVVACYSGQTAGQTTAVLKALGYDAVSLHFGMKGWVDMGAYPVVAE